MGHKTCQLMLYKGIIALCSEIHPKYRNRLCWHNLKILNVKPDGAWRNRWPFKGELTLLLHGTVIGSCHCVFMVQRPLFSSLRTEPSDLDEDFLWFAWIHANKRVRRIATVLRITGGTPLLLDNWGSLIIINDVSPRFHNGVPGYVFLSEERNSVQENRKILVFRTFGGPSPLTWVCGILISATE